MKPIDFVTLSLMDKIRKLYEEGSFIVAIRYYRYKVNLYLMNNFYVEVFYNHKEDKIERIELLDYSHSRFKFYADQIRLPDDMQLLP